MIKGVDLSSLSSVERHGGKFYLNNKQQDCISIIKQSGFNLVRLRLFNDPFDEEKNSYQIGDCDLDGVIETAKRIKEYGFDWLLDFHYSDAWADPGKQTLPKSWRNHSLQELIEAVYEFSKHTLEELKRLDLSPSIVQIGNEVTNGLLWPIGKKPNYENIALLISSGIRACREVLPEAKIMIHIDKGTDNELFNDFFDNYFRYNGLDFDYIGLSYYIFWHGSLDDLENNMKLLYEKYHKEMIIVETSYVFTDEDYKQYENLEDHQRKGMATKSHLLEGLPFEISEDGQSDYMQYLMELIDATKGCLGFVYWGGESLPVEGMTWANDKAIEYMNEIGPGGLEWCNQALFDYDGNALKILETIKNYK